MVEHSSEPLLCTSLNAKDIINSGKNDSSFDDEDILVKCALLSDTTTATTTVAITAAATATHTKVDNHLRIGEDDHSLLSLPNGIIKVPICCNDIIAQFIFLFLSFFTFHFECVSHVVSCWAISALSPCLSWRSTTFFSFPFWSTVSKQSPNLFVQVFAHLQLYSLVYTARPFPLLRQIKYPLWSFGGQLLCVWYWVFLPIDLPM